MYTFKLYYFQIPTEHPKQMVISSIIITSKTKHLIIFCLDLQITVYPHELTVREGREASFECRARTSDNAAYAQVRWTRVGGRLPENVYDSGGRLTFNPAHLSHSGRYACVATNQGRSVEAYATLNVQSCKCYRRSLKKRYAFLEMRWMDFFISTIILPKTKFMAQHA